LDAYIFLTSEGYTFQPNSEARAPDIENLQVIGFAEAATADDALADLLANFPYLTETTFDVIFCYKLEKDYERTRRDFHLKMPR